MTKIQIKILVPNLLKKCVKTNAPNSPPPAQTGTNNIYYSTNEK